MDRILYISLMFDFYNTLLTSRQRTLFTMYYFENMTFNEIGTELGISLQAVRDIVKRTEHNLEQYEQALGLTDKFMKQKRCSEEIFAALDKFESKCESLSEDVTKVKNLMQQLML